MKADCIFCAISSGRAPASVVAEGARSLAFRDIRPAAPTHLLIIPKDHIADSAADLTEAHGEILGEMLQLAAQAARQEGLDDWRLVGNVGTAAGQTVFHLHFHLLGGWGDASGVASLADEAGG